MYAIVQTISSRGLQRIDNAIKHIMRIDSTANVSTATSHCQIHRQYQYETIINMLQLGAHIARSAETFTISKSDLDAVFSPLSLVHYLMHVRREKPKLNKLASQKLMILLLSPNSAFQLSEQNAATFWAIYASEPHPTCLIPF